MADTLQVIHSHRIVVAACELSALKLLHVNTYGPCAAADPNNVAKFLLRLLLCEIS